MKYLQAWASDAAGNISLAPFQRLVSYVPPTDTVGRDQTRVSRVELDVGDTLRVSITPTNGDPDLYVWSPEAGAPPFVSNLSVGTDIVEVTVENAAQAGVYQIEVYGYTAAAYTQAVEVTRASLIAVQQNGGVDPDKPQRTTPAVPLASVPSVQQSTPPAPVGDTQNPPDETGQIYLPLVRR